MEYPCLYIISCDGKALASQLNKHTEEKKKKLLGRDAISKIAKWLFNLIFNKIKRCSHLGGVLL